MDNIVKEFKCRLCSGRKVVNGLGGMDMECPECKGLGICYDILSTDELNEMEEKKKTLELEKKLALRDTVVNDMTRKLLQKRPNLLEEEARSIAEKEVNNIASLKDIDQKVEISRRSRKKSIDHNFIKDIEEVRSPDINQVVERLSD